MKKKRYLSLINPFEKTKKRRIHINPTLPPPREEPLHSVITEYEFSPQTYKLAYIKDIESCLQLQNNNFTKWLNIDGLKKNEVEQLGQHFDIHPLLVEDILSLGQRPKMDELNDIVFVLLNMLYFNEESQTIENEQISIFLTKNMVISFQEDPSRDVFTPVRERIKATGSKIRNNQADYLFYSMIDIIVDNYFLVIEKIALKIEKLEDDIVGKANPKALGSISFLRKEILFLKRNISPVRELITGILRSENILIEEKTEKYFKDVHDHILQATEQVENYRYTMINLQDLYLSQVNVKMNEVMKVMAVVTCLLAPATVIGGIFGMNFSVIPGVHDRYGFYLTVGLMLLVPVWMIWVFKKRGWF